MKLKETTRCLLLQLWMKNVNQWHLPTDGEPSPPKPGNSQSGYPVMYPAYFSSVPFPFPMWPGYSTEPTKVDTHEVLKPTAVHSKSPINVDELVGMSNLSLGEPKGQAGPSSLSLNLVEGSSRQSAFHANPSSGSSRRPEKN